MSEFEPSGPSGRNLSWFEAGRYASPPCPHPLPDGMLVHHRAASQHLYICVERGTVRVKCLSQEQNTLTPDTLIRSPAY